MTPGASGPSPVEPPPELPGAAYAAALTELPLPPARLAALIWHRAPADVWHAVRSGRISADEVIGERGARGKSASEVVAKLAAAAGAIDVERGWEALGAARVTVVVLGAPGYPQTLAGDHEAPAVLFALGDVSALDRPRVAIVGTRRATHYGRDVARELGRDLAAAGVAVVSGLAAGIDGAAHEGALAPDGGAPPVAVVGSGLDMVYPARNSSLWHRVAASGVVLSEAPLGAAPEPWRFPARNRILAALAQVVVVVESHEQGGSLHTVRAAIERGVPVMAVPGSVRSPASAGTNALLADGAAPVRDATDVVVALRLAGAEVDVSSPAVDGGGAAAGGDGVAGLVGDPVTAAVLDAVDWSPTSTETVLRRTGLGLARGATILNRLEVGGLVRATGGWWERVPLTTRSGRVRATRARGGAPAGPATA